MTWASSRATTGLGFAALLPHPTAASHSPVPSVATIFHRHNLFGPWHHSAPPNSHSPAEPFSSLLFPDEVNDIDEGSDDGSAERSFIDLSGARYTSSSDCPQSSRSPTQFVTTIRVHSDQRHDDSRNPPSFGFDDRNLSSSWYSSNSTLVSPQEARDPWSYGDGSPPIFVRRRWERPFSWDEESGISERVEAQSSVVRLEETLGLTVPEAVFAAENHTNQSPPSQLRSLKRDWTHFNCTEEDDIDVLSSEAGSEPRRNFIIRMQSSENHACWITNEDELPSHTIEEELPDRWHCAVSTADESKQPAADSAGFSRTMVGTAPSALGDRTTPRAADGEPTFGENITFRRNLFPDSGRLSSHRATEEEEAASFEESATHQPPSFQFHRRRKSFPRLDFGIDEDDRFSDSEWTENESMQSPLATRSPLTVVLRSSSDRFDRCDRTEEDLFAGDANVDGPMTAGQWDSPSIIAAPHAPLHAPLTKALLMDDFDEAISESGAGRRLTSALSFTDVEVRPDSGFCERGEDDDRHVGEEYPEEDEREKKGDPVAEVYESLRLPPTTSLTIRRRSAALWDLSIVEEDWVEAGQGEDRDIALTMDIYTEEIRRAIPRLYRQGGKPEFVDPEFV
ncbi:hypothetical protein DFJ73DRAFT_829355 [Zopfochytrium polystomum]|nr:hypothetical protein DFJ73DRAFT_829355 [Zopfochytrium polystomum]